MSWSTDDDARTILQFLTWYNTYTLAGTDEEIVRRFIEEREAER